MVLPRSGRRSGNNYVRIPTLEAKTIFATMQRQYPEKFADGQLRTLQRRIKHWRASEGPAQEVYFVQEHRAGELCESDFTHLTELAITIGGQPFPHMLYHFVLTYSNWETGTSLPVGELCQPKRRSAECALGTGRSAEATPHGSDDGGRQ